MLALCCFIGAAAAESVPVHEDSHRTVERVHGKPVIRKSDSLDTHTVVTNYDLYCEDCGRVIRENVRTETTEEAHTWSVARVDPTCEEEGEESRLCTSCGMEDKKTLPRTAHVFARASQLVGHGVGTVAGTGEYAGKTVGRVTAAPACTESGKGVLICVNCGKAEQPVTIPASGHDWSAWEDVEVPTEKICVTEAQMARRCKVCGTEETRVVAPAPGHKWEDPKVTEPTCTEKGASEKECSVCHTKEREDIPALGHTYADVSLLIKHKAGSVMGTGADAGKTIGQVTKASTCTETGSGSLNCLRCQNAAERVTIPKGDHAWGEWVEEEIEPDKVCLTDLHGTRTCKDCGEEETQVLTPAPGHKWAAISFEEPTCTEGGRAVRKCSRCQKEEVMEAPPLGHTFMWVDKSTPTPYSNGVREYVCTVCGYVADTQSTAYAQMYYNNTVTSFGPMTRDLIGGNVWNRVTPLDLSLDGVYTFPLIASNLYTVGTATVEIEHGIQIVTYKLNSKNIKVHKESLVFYPNVDSLRTGENALPAPFDTPLYLWDVFEGDNYVIMAITLKADYDAGGSGVQGFRPDQELIDAMALLLD